MKAVNYDYPVGDFLSGFSEDENNPCDYELECQRMVKRGVEYLDEHPELFDEISKGPVGVSDKVCELMINFMCSNTDSNEENFGQTGAMFHHTVKHAYNAKKLGWDNYIQQITSKE